MLHSPGWAVVSTHIGHMREKLVNDLINGDVQARFEIMAIDNLVHEIDNIVEEGQVQRMQNAVEK